MNLFTWHLNWAAMAKLFTISQFLIGANSGSMKLTLKRTADNRARVRLNG
jgi:hypothetical protein